MPTNGRQFATVQFSDGSKVDVVTRASRYGLPLYSNARQIKADAELIRHEQERLRTND